MSPERPHLFLAAFFDLGDLGLERIEILGNRSKRFQHFTLLFQTSLLLDTLDFGGFGIGLTLLFSLGGRALTLTLDANLFRMLRLSKL